MYGFTNSIRPYSSLEYFERFLKDDQDAKCEICGNPTRFIGLFDGYKKFCSDKCSGGFEKRREAVKNRFINQPDKVQAFKEKYNCTISKVDTNILKERRQRQVETTKIHYGEDYFSQKTKSQWERRSKEDVKQLVDKSNETKRKNGTLDIGSFVNSNKKVFIKGKEFFCQGYEDQVIKTLIEDFEIDPDQVKTGRECPRVKYDGNKSGWYRPDIFIEPYSLYIEVKSEWTFFGKKDFLIENINKQNAVLQNGLKHIIIVILTEMTDDDKQNLKLVLDTVISSQDSFESKVQRLSLRGVQPNRVWGWKHETS